MANELPKIKCWKCGHEFVPRVANPQKCPNPRCQASLSHVKIEEEKK